jgi:hypothetical protein
LFKIEFEIRDTAFLIKNKKNPEDLMSSRVLVDHQGLTRICLRKSAVLRAPWACSDQKGPPDLSALSA